MFSFVLSLFGSFTFFFFSLSLSSLPRFVTDCCGLFDAGAGARTIFSLFTSFNPVAALMIDHGRGVVVFGTEADYQRALIVRQMSFAAFEDQFAANVEEVWFSSSSTASAAPVSATQIASVAQRVGAILDPMNAAGPFLDKLYPPQQQQQQYQPKSPHVSRAPIVEAPSPRAAVEVPPPRASVAQRFV